MSMALHSQSAFLSPSHPHCNSHTLCICTCTLFLLSCSHWCMCVCVFNAGMAVCVCVCVWYHCKWAYLLQPHRYSVLYKHFTIVCLHLLFCTSTQMCKLILNSKNQSPLLQLISCFCMRLYFVATNICCFSLINVRIFRIKGLSELLITALCSTGTITHCMCLAQKTLKNCFWNALNSWTS